MRSGSVIIVHNKEHLEAALSIAEEMALPVQLQTPSAAIGYIGASVLKEMLDQASAKYTRAQFNFVCDAGEDPAQVQEAFQVGFQMVRFTGNDAVREKLESIAGHYQGLLCCEEDEALEVLDLCFVEDAKDACRRWCLSLSLAAA